jgi:glutamate N-acetyltransferase / amino-acid N-acetyltransferase
MKNISFQVKGFLSAVTKAHIKEGSDREDLGLIVSETPAAAAGVFTRNQVKAASVLIDQERIQAGLGRAILVNSGNANACTGDRGLKDTRTLTRQAATLLAIPEDQVFMASTGVIGLPLPLRRMQQAIPALKEGLSPGGLPALARAIMTTDTFPKIVAQEVTLGKRTGRVVGMAKGAGMIRPDMATMLCFVLTDVAVTAEALNRILAEAVDQSFNRITVDGDTSTNDLVLVLANGRAGNQPLTDVKSPEARSFSRALNRVLLGLAKLIVQDGEGATKQVELIVKGARTAEEARIMGFTVANSPLVKTALFGEDANWGRILAALGRSGIAFNPAKVDLFFGPVQVVGRGISLGSDREAPASRVLKKSAFTVTVDLHLGKARASVFTCDLSLDYVKINAHYRT